MRASDARGSPGEGMSFLMEFKIRNQRIQGHPGDWNLVRAYGCRAWVHLEYESDAPGNRQRITLDGETGKVLWIIEGRMNDETAFDR